MKSVEMAKARIKEILDGRESELATARTKFEKVSSSAELAASEVDSAMKQGDLDAFKEATARKNDLDAAKAMYGARLEYLTNKPLISSTEYAALVSEILEEHELKRRGAKQRIAELADKMAVIADEFAAITNEANATLEQLQGEVYRNADRQKLASGEFMPNTKKRVTGGDVLHWGRLAKNSPHYENFKHER